MLIPVSQWEYDLYRVTYHKDDQTKIKYMASSCSNHLEEDIQRFWPSDYYDEYSYEVISENVSKPKVVGNFHGINMYETSLSHGERLAKALNLT